MTIKFLNKALLIENKKRILVLGDLHLGYEEAMNKVGILIPRFQFQETLKELKEIFREIGKVDEIVILGDFKHEFGGINKQEWRDVLRVLDFLKKMGGKVVLIKGNHDSILGPIAQRKEVKIKDFYVKCLGEKERICFLHGHKNFLKCLDKNIKILIMGHRHPAVVLQDKYKKERYKCFLRGKWKKKDVIILPSFFPFIEGSDVVNIGKNRLFIPERNLKSFSVLIYEEKTGRVYDFGKLKNLREI